MLTLIKNVHVFTPEPLGEVELLIADSRFACIDGRVDIRGAAVSEFDGQGAWLVPGFVDSLTHPCGGGGEGGFGNRTAEVDADTFIEAGVTSPVGALGTDSITRSLEVLFGTVLGLRERGLSAFMYTGSYRAPVVTVTGDIARDLILLDPVIGVGEVAIADHRGSQPSAAELRRLAADSRLGGIISGKGGTVMLHVGDGSGGLQLMRDALADSDLPARSFYPTHINRHAELLRQGIEHAKAGGYIDMTVSTTDEFVEAGEVPALSALRQALAAGAPTDRVTFSSDAGGSLPLYVDGELKGLTSASPASLLALLQAVIQEGAEDLPQVLAALTANPAAALGLAGKGRIEVGADADLLLLDPATGALRAVMCRGRWLKSPVAD